jgi:transposase
VYVARMDDVEPPICPVCGVTMVPSALSSRDDVSGEWVCLECEEADAGEE